MSNTRGSIKEHGIQKTKENTNKYNQGIDKNNTKKSTTNNIPTK